MLMKAPFTPAVGAIAAAIAALANWWGETNNKVKLMMNNPAVSADLVVGDITEATFGGYAAKTATAAAVVVIDSLTGNLLIRVPEIAGGWSWTATGTPPANSPQSVYGAYVTNNAGDKLLGIAKFDTPRVITVASQNIDIGSVDFVVNPNPLG